MILLQTLCKNFMTLNNAQSFRTRFHKKNITAKDLRQFAIPALPQSRQPNTRQQEIQNDRSIILVDAGTRLKK